MSPRAAAAEPDPEHPEQLMMTFAVEAWSPDYGGSLDGDDDRIDSTDIVDAEVEVPLAKWEPLSPRPGCTVPDTVLITDGVQRTDARIWIQRASGRPALGVCASYGAGAVLCRPGRAELASSLVARGVFSAAPETADIPTALGTYVAHIAASGEIAKLRYAINQAMGLLEAEAGRAAVAALDGELPDLVIADGRLRQGAHLQDTVGYLKSHASTYLPPEGEAVVARLGDGQRSPLFGIGGPFSRSSWYLRLPNGGGGDPWNGVVRCEVAGHRPVALASEIADIVTLTLPRFASHLHKDPRAPQNLYPIAGLERTLRHRLGDAELLVRSLRRVAAAPRPVTAAGPLEVVP